MSQLSSALQGLQASIAEALLTGSLTGSVSTGLSTLLAENPSLTLSEAITNINNDLSTYLGNAIAKLPGWEQVIGQILLVAETPAIQTWVDGIVTHAYTKLVSQLAGTKAAQTIVATAPVVTAAITEPIASGLLANTAVAAEVASEDAAAADPNTVAV